jgi:hypothetical protein
MNLLLLTPEGPEADFNDSNYERGFRMGGANVVRLSPEMSYIRGGQAALESDVVSLANEHRIDVLVYQLGGDFDFEPCFFRDNLSQVYKVLLLEDDGQYFHVSHRYYAQCVDFVLTVNPPLCEHYALIGIDAQFMATPFDASVFSPAPHKRRDIDVSFIGDMVSKEGRVGYARSLADAGIDVKTYGTGTSAGFISRDQVVDVFHRSRINLNFTRSGVTPLDAHLPINRRVRQVKGRNTKIALCGSFLLSEYAPGIERIFDIGKEIDVFQDERELVEKVRFYLAHNELREEMATRAHKRALEHYDERKFWPRLVGALERRAQQRTRRPSLPIGFDPPFWSRFAAWRFKYLVVFLFATKFQFFARELVLLLKIGRLAPYVAIWAAVMGLNVASRTSRLASWLNSTRRRLRDLVRKRAGRLPAE